MPTITPTSKAIQRYYAELADYRGSHVTHELALKTAFQTLLQALAPTAGWMLIPEQTMANGKRPDGTLRDAFNLPRGYWEAKDTGDDLATEIRKKIALGYPLVNTIFEDTRRAVLYQNKKLAFEADLAKPRDLADLLRMFFTHTEPELEDFHTAVEEFKERIPELAQGLMERIQQEHAAANPAFKAAWASFFTLCRASLDPNMRSETVDEMLVQHLLTERLFRTVFQNPDFTRRNVIASEIEKVIGALTSRAFDRNEFLRSLDRFYVAVESAAKGLDDWSEKQAFLNTVYERFFQGFSAKQADTLGIVYTPQEIVDFMCASVDEVLKREFDASLSTPGVQILDPATGTGNFIVNLIRRMSGATLREKYANDLFANEIMLLPYYIASLNIEHAYYERMGEYRAFEGLCFTDTLELAEGRQMALFTEANTERVAREKAAQIMVVIGNPPYNVGQGNENDNNKNRKYPVIDGRVRETYGRDSNAVLQAKLYDAYVKFFRWATDRLRGGDGIVCFVSNNYFIDGVSFDGLRKHLLQDFTQIYHLDLKGNARLSPERPRASGGNVFGIRVGVGITLAVRATKHVGRKLYYHSVPDGWRKEEKLAFLAKTSSCTEVEWHSVEPDEKHTWLTEGMHREFETFVATGLKEGSPQADRHVQSIFRAHSPGVVTSRDDWVYDFQRDTLISKMQRFIRNYNSEVFRWSQESHDVRRIEDYLNADPTFVKWTDRLKDALVRGRTLKFDAAELRIALYRPFCSKLLYFDHLLNQRRYQQHLYFPAVPIEGETVAMCVSGPGNRMPFGALAARLIPSFDLAFEKTQTFPFYTYAEDGSSRRENITDWALTQFQARYGGDVTKWDIFHYVYGILHHPQYRARYAENLKRELPRIPLLPERAQYEACVRAGRELLPLHLEYEQAREYPLRWVEAPGAPVNWRVEKMKLTADKTTLRVNDWLTLEGIPPECGQYRLGNRAALEWVVDQYQVSTDKRSGITSDPNRAEEPEYIARLVGRVVSVSVETARLVGELERAVDLLAALGVGVTAK